MWLVKFFVKIFPNHLRFQNWTHDFPALLWFFFYINNCLIVVDNMLDTAPHIARQKSL